VKFVSFPLRRRARDEVTIRSPRDEVTLHGLRFLLVKSKFIGLAIGKITSPPALSSRRGE
jgi:hypothetical protein